MDTAAESNNIVSYDGSAVAFSSLKISSYYVFNDTSYITLDGVIDNSVQPPLIYNAVLHEDNATESVRVTGKY